MAPLRGGGGLMGVAFDFRQQLSGPWESASPYLIEQFDRLFAGLSTIQPLLSLSAFPASSVLVTDNAGAPSFSTTLPVVTVGSAAPLVRIDGSVVLPTALNFTAAATLPPTASDKGVTAVANALTATSLFAFPSHGFMAAEAYAWSKSTSASAEVIGLRGVGEQGGSGAVSLLDGVQGFVTLSSSGGGSFASCFDAFPMGRITGAATGTFTNGVGLLVNAFGAGFTNVYALYSADLTAGIFLKSDIAAKSTTNTWQVTSDRRTKRDIRDFTDGLRVLEQLRPVHFTYNGIGDTTDGVQGIGLIAQEAEPFAPSIIKSRNASDGQTYKTLDSGDVTWMLVNAVKELSARVTELER